MAVSLNPTFLIEGTLCGFVMPQLQNIDRLKEATGKMQPYYTVPTEIMGLNTFPEPVNGKTDKRFLCPMAMEQSIPQTEKIIDLLVPPSAVYLTPGSDGQGKLTLHSLPSISTETEFSDTAVKLKAASTQEEYLDDDIPDKTQGKWLRNLRHQVFTIYRRLFGVVFVINIAVFIVLVLRGANSQKVAEIAIANLFCAILMRQDHVVNAFFNVFCAVPPSWPLWIRSICARVYHIGGLHSGCATAGVVWLTLFAGKATQDMVNRRKISIATVALTYAILLLLFGILLFAYPTMRTKRHDAFERSHRFLGWTSTAAVWGQVVFLTNDYKEPGMSLAHALRVSVPFWLLVIMTGSIILPWVRLRKVTVRSERLSSHAVRIYFEYATPVPGTFVRISESPLMEWHGFATIPEPNMKGFSLVVSKAGDWTSNQINNPPSELWVRGIPTCGVMRIVPLFRRLVLVATGSGIGPCAPCILEKKVPIRLLWTSPNVRQTFGDKLVDSILNASPDAVVYDTRVHGKPDMIKLTYRLVREFNAEAVCIISNQKLTRKVVYGMMARGIPAFGAIWDVSTLRLGLESLPTLAPFSLESGLD
ncbi:hypothetical protein C8J56DRAFT_787431 [Mycena floridula]|nr:hypothetical protein C8J56DRAFT_787431 [Mycena floridula]